MFRNSRPAVIIVLLLSVLGLAAVVAAPSASAATSGCGNACNHQDPQTYQAFVPEVGTVTCGSDAVTARQPPTIMGRTLQLRYSTRCRTVWARLFGGMRLDRAWLRQWVVEGGFGHWQYLDFYDFSDLQNHNWSFMWNDANVTISACIAPRGAPGRDELMWGCTAGW